MSTCLSATQSAGIATLTRVPENSTWPSDYLEAVRVEIASSARAHEGAAATTLYIGGGTPSLLPSDAIASIIAWCREAFALAAEAEVTLEANPGTIDYAIICARYGWQG
jgi:coproporphyrinogen III oxidase-like Fe-S oxidoreductase